MDGLLALLAPHRGQQPVVLQVDAASGLAARLAARAEPLRWDDVLAALQVLVPALLVAATDELGDAVLRALAALLQRAGVGGRSRATSLALQLGEAHLLHHRTPLPKLVSLLALVLEGDAAETAANAMPEREHLLRALVGGMAPEPGSPSGCASLCMRVFVRMLTCHGASAGSVLARGGISMESLLALLPSHPSVELLELYEECACDPTLATKIACPAVLGALKSPLISGPPPLQLATIHLLSTLRRTPETAPAIATADLVPYCLEVCRVDGGAECHAEPADPSCVRRRGHLSFLLVPSTAYSISRPVTDGILY
jgi:hypothetical protein